MSEDKIQPLGILRDAGDGTFSLVVRWLLGEEEALPLIDDTFLVTVKLIPSGKVIFRDGRVGEPDGSEVIEVRPRAFAMIDPPRRAVEIGKTPEGDISYQMVAVQPVGPVDPGAPGVRGSLMVESSVSRAKAESMALGIVHLLDESEPSRMEWRVAKALYPAMKRGAADLANKTRSGLRSLNALSQNSDPAEISARAMSRFLLRSGTRPMDLPTVLTRAVTQFRALAIGPAASQLHEELLPEVFRLEGQTLPAQIDHATLITRSLNDHETLEAADREYSSRKQARQHLRLRAMQGGELIDFWCDPDNTAPNCSVESRGSRYPAAELTGNGVQIDGIPADALREWSTVSPLQRISIKVEHRAGGAPRDDVPLNDTSNVGNSNFVAPVWSKGTAQPIKTPDICNALKQGSTHVPPPPKSAFVNYNLKHDTSAVSQGSGALEDDAPSEKLNSLTGETGDGKVQILIEGPNSDSGEATTVFSFNLYGVWEGAPGMEDLFADGPDPDPTSLYERLKPFRISVRYSLTRDLLPAFAGAPGVAAILEALSDPPWFPILRAPDATFDTSEPPQQSDTQTTPNRHDPMPPVARAGLTSTTVDLRKGIDFDNPNMSGYALAWDPFGKLETRWTPETDRQGKKRLDRPQYFRFWVTSVDPFDQESVPVPVRANDAEAGEPLSYLFAPRYRTPLPAPRKIAVDDQSAEKELTIDDTGKLSVRWRTPFLERVGTAGDVKQELLDKSRLKARVAIYRRRVKGLTASDLIRTFSETDDLPQWMDTHQSMREQGFTHWKTSVNVEAPDNGDIWSFETNLDFVDRDHEYTAAVSFSVNENWSTFWAPDLVKGVLGSEGREALRFELIDGEYVPKIEYITEVPRQSDVSITNTRLFANNHAPRAPRDLETSFEAALPVLPVEDIQRDLVLVRLLGHDVDEQEKRVWQDTLVDMTSAQALMCDSAIGRVGPVDGKPAMDPAAEDLKELRKIFAAAIAAPQDRVAPDGNSPIRTRDVLGQHPVVGFRGIQSLKCQVIPFVVEAPESETVSEAAAVRFYQVRVPLSHKDATAYATMSGDGTLINAGGTSYALSNISVRDDEALRAIATADDNSGSALLSQPSAALVLGDGSQPSRVLPILELDLSTPDKPVVKLDNNGDHLSAASQIMIFAAHEIAEQRVESFDTADECSIKLPIGGGFPEVFLWWLVPVSALGTEAPPENRLVHKLQVPMTIEPEVPVLFQARPPMNDGEALDPGNLDHVSFLPKSIDDPALANLNPRLVLSWRDPRPAANAKLIVFRKRQKISEDGMTEQRARLLEAPVNDWETVKTIEGLKSGEKIPLALLENLRSWLLGLSVPSKNGGETSEEDFDFIDVTRSLQSGKGLIELDFGTDGKRPGFVDYYYSNDDGYFAMEGSFRYAYKAQRVIDLDPDGAFGLPEAQKYLRSRTTGWTQFQRPVNQPFKILPDESFVDKGARLPATFGPEIEFRFRTPFTKMPEIRSLNEAPNQIREWFYKIVVRRLVERGMPSSEDEEFVPQWIPIGKPQRLDYLDPDGNGEVVITDRSIDRLHPSDEPAYRYSIGVTQMAVIEDHNQEPVGEVMVRRGEKNNGEDHELKDLVIVPAMETRTLADGRIELLAERRVTIPVLIK